MAVYCTDASKMYIETGNRSGKEVCSEQAWPPFMDTLTPKEAVMLRYIICKIPEEQSGWEYNIEELGNAINLCPEEVERVYAALCKKVVEGDMLREADPDIWR